MNTIPDSVMLYIQHDFYKMIFKIKHKLCIASGSAPHPTKEISGCSPEERKKQGTELRKAEMKERRSRSNKREKEEV
jgi:hypothetical protein